ncbi:MAG: hypothetical protein JJ974_07865 [Phycisphaerales bacterium]|nr:hypothetical protein [Phycisphaerales bacterium]
MQHSVKFYATTLALLVSSVSIATTQPADSNSQAQPIRNISEWDLSKKSLAIDGYDPVAYFPEGGSKATKGKKSITLTHKGVDYRFASEANKAAFIANPSKYEPAYGAWCAWAMSRGSKTEVDPKSFIVKDDRLFLFYKGVFGNTKKDWQKGDHKKLSSQADQEWKSISGESPRPHTDE